MDSRPAAILAALLGTSGFAASASRAEISLPRVLSDGMVLQQKAPIRLFGRAAPGEKVGVKLGALSGSAVTDAEGQWATTLRPLPAGGPYTLTVSGTNTITVSDILVGEVWVCSGQSNMEWAVTNTVGAPEAIAASADPKLRMFTVTKSVKGEPQYDVAGGTWENAGPQTTPRFSAVGYYFARALRKKLGIPVGMIHTSWGGTRIETWMSRETLISVGIDPKEWDAYRRTPEDMKARVAAYEKQVALWKAAGSPRGATQDTGISDAAKDWATPGLAQEDWQTIRVPGIWEQSGIESLANLNGAVWFRKEINLPADWNGGAATLTLGAIDDYDTTFVNGVKVGATGAETDSAWQALRRYPVPAELLKAGKNVIAVRVWDGAGGGGFTGSAPSLRLSPVAGSVAPVALDGDWRFRIERAVISDPGGPPSAFNQQTVSGLYNGMLAPLTKYGVKGAIWYQGESNAFKGSGYEVRMPAMIRNWRQAWGIADFPFFLVQLAPYAAGNSEADSWAYLREAQLKTTTILPNVGMAVITDVGELNDIHPRNKEPVGERLALLARQIAYGEKNLNAAGPRLEAVRYNGGKAVLRFTDTGGGLEARGLPGRQTTAAPTPEGFTIAGADGRFVAASARITAPNIVEVSAPGVTAPRAVRFGWKNYPLVDLWSKAGLPATPFRTDGS
ncbi:MAG: 9-O-acetylesterase [Cytophagales bacterium]|nr:9-O-acetylesterase [Armatimonadota bacterium]